MKVLVACEFSGRVRDAFRKRGHDAWSCDLLPSPDGSSFHKQMDIFELLDSDPVWDLMIAHPDCTYLTNTAAYMLHEKPGQRKRKAGTLVGSARWRAMEKACLFFNQLKDYSQQIPKVCLENPIPHGYAKNLIGDYTQIVHPWQFGHPESKSTCLWLFGLPELTPTDDVYEAMMKLPKREREATFYQSPGVKDGLTRAQRRSVTFQGVADAMADQWGVSE